MMLSHPTKKTKTLSGKFVIAAIFATIGFMSFVLFRTMTQSESIRHTVSQKINNQMLLSLNISELKTDFPNLAELSTWNLEMQGFNFELNIPKKLLSDEQIIPVKPLLEAKVLAWLKTQFPDGKELRVTVLFN